MGQVDIKFGVNGMKENSIIMLNAMCSCYGKDSVFYMLDSLSYHGLFVKSIQMVLSWIFPSTVLKTPHFVRKI